MTRKEVWELSAEEFFTHIITIICDYAKINGYEITDAVKTIGENLSEITKIATFDNWEINEEALGKDINVTSKWIPCSERLTERDAYWIGEEFWTSAREPDDEEIDEVYMKLKDYEDLEEQGLLVKLHCKGERQCGL